MTEHRMRNAMIGLQCTLGLVILVEAVLFVMPGSRHDFSRTHVPDVLRLVLGWGEIAGSILLLIPRTAARGAWLLLGVFVLAIAVHVLHGMFEIGNLVIYAAAGWAIAAARAN